MQCGRHLVKERHDGKVAIRHDMKPSQVHQGQWLFAASAEAGTVIGQKRARGIEQKEALPRWLFYPDNPDQKRYPRKQCHENVFPIGEIVCKQSSNI
jgi:hypothetical protein